MPVLGGCDPGDPESGRRELPGRADREPAGRGSVEDVDGDRRWWDRRRFGLRARCVWCTRCAWRTRRVEGCAAVPAQRRQEGVELTRIVDLDRAVAPELPGGVRAVGPGRLPDGDRLEADRVGGHPAQPGREVAQVVDGGAVVHGQRSRRGREQTLQFRRIGEHSVACRLLEHRADELLLAPDPVKISVRQAVALSDERQGLLAVEMVLTDDAVPLGPLVVQVRCAAIRQRSYADGDSADGVRHGLEAGEVDRHEVVDFDIGEVLERSDQQRRAAERDRRVQLVATMSGNRDEGVPGKRHQCGRSVGVEVGNHGRVGALSGDDFFALVLVTGALPAVGSDQQEVLGPRGGLCRPLGLVETERHSGDLGVEVTEDDVTTAAHGENGH